MSDENEEPKEALPVLLFASVLISCLVLDKDSVKFRHLSPGRISMAPLRKLLIFRDGGGLRFLTLKTKNLKI